MAGGPEFRELNDSTRRRVQTACFGGSDAGRVAYFAGGKILVELAYQALGADFCFRRGAVGIA